MVIVILSGPLSVGKSTIAETASRRRQYVHISVRDLLISASSTPLLTREDRQHFGAELECRTAGRWLPDLVRPLVMSNPTSPATYIVDSVRTLTQAIELKRAFERHCLHVHLSATRSTLQTRFDGRAPTPGEASTYDRAIAHSIEQNEADLMQAADVVVVTDQLSAEETARRLEAAIDEFVSR